MVKPVSGGFIGSDAVGGGCDGCGGGGGGDDGGAAVDVAEAPCSPGTTRCGDAGRERCDEGAKWRPAPCPSAQPACIAGACVACVPESERCSEGARERCDGSGVWVAHPCPSAKPLCFGNGCHFCVPDLPFCLGGDGLPSEGAAVAAICDGSGDDVATTAACGEGVACGAGVCQICSAGATRCATAAMGAGRERCAADGGVWLPEPCPTAAPLCADGACLVCAPGSERCAPTAGPTPLRERCDEVGASWQPLPPCTGSQICHLGACTTCVPGEGRCLGGKAMVCAVAGDGWVLASDCAKDGLACSAGQCACAAAQTSCAAPKAGLPAATGLITCTGSGDGAVPATNCAPAEVCVGKQCVACVEGKGRCADDDAQSCKVGGGGFALVQSCADIDQICAHGACVAPCGGGSGGGGSGGGGGGNVGCAFAGVDPRLQAPADAPPATVHVLARLGDAKVSATSWAAAPAPTPGGAATAAGAKSAGGALSVSLQSLGAAAGDPATTSGPAHAFTLSLDQPAGAWLESRLGDGSSGALAALPAGGEAGVYRLAAWPSEGGEALATFTVVAFIQSALVSLTPAVALKDPTGATLQPGVAVAVDVPAKGARTFYASGVGDPTGTLLIADAPVAVLVGHRAAHVPRSDACEKPKGAGAAVPGACASGGALCFADADCPQPCCADALLYALPPVARWGTLHAVARSVARGAEHDVVRVVAHQAGTIVLTEPMTGPPVVLDAGGALDLEAKGDLFIASSAKVAVVHLLAGRGATGLGKAATGDPAAAIVTPVSAGVVRAPFYAPASSWSARHLAVAAPAGTLVEIDGAGVALSATIGKSGFAAYRTTVAPGAHLLRCSAPCTAMVHGYGAAAGFAARVGWAP